MQEGPKAAKCFLRKFSPASKLRTASDYSYVFADKPKALHHKNCLVLCKPGQTNSPRLGLAITKKHCKRAVDRNRIKRIIREEFRMHQQTLKPLDLVFISKPGLAQQTKTAVHLMAANLLQQLS